MMRSIQLAVACVAVLMATAGQVQAGVIFSNFGPGDSYTTSFAKDIWSTPNDIDSAMGFKVAGTIQFTLTSIELAVLNPNNNIGGGNVMDVFLMADSSGQPGNLIESFQLTLPGPFFGGILSATSVLNPILNSNTQYWLVASAAEPNSQLGWYFDSDGFFSGNGPTLSRTNGGRWRSASSGQAAFRLSGDPQVSAVPEPSSLALFGIGACIAGVGAARRRRREKQQEATV